MELDLVRKELNKYDNLIKEMVCLRMSLIPIVADIKIKNNMPLFQEKREDEIYKNIEIFSEKNGVDSILIKDIYKLIIANAIKMQESIVNDSKKSILNNDIDLTKLEGVKNDFEKLDSIITQEIPEIILRITRICEKENLKLNELSTLYYDSKIDN